MFLKMAQYASYYLILRMQLSVFSNNREISQHLLAVFMKCPILQFQFCLNFTLKHTENRKRITLALSASKGCYAANTRHRLQAFCSVLGKECSLCSGCINDNEEGKIQLIILLIQQAKVPTVPLPPPHWTKHFIALTLAPTLKHSVILGEKTLHFAFIRSADIAAE